MNYCFFPSWFGSQSHLIWEVVSFSIIAWSLFLVWLFAFFIWCAQNEGLAERNSHCANLLLVGRRQYWAQHLAEPVEGEMYCRLSKLAWAWGFNPQEQGGFVQGSDTCSSLQAPSSSDFPGTLNAIPGKWSLSSPCTPGNWPTAIPKHTSSLAYSQLDLAWELFLRVSPRIFTAFLRRRAGIVSFPETPVKAKLLQAR